MKNSKFTPYFAALAVLVVLIVWAEWETEPDKPTVLGIKIAEINSLEYKVLNAAKLTGQSQKKKQSKKDKPKPPPEKDPKKHKKDKKKKKKKNLNKILIGDRKKLEAYSVVVTPRKFGDVDIKTIAEEAGGLYPKYLANQKRTYKQSRLLLTIDGKQYIGNTNLYSAFQGITDWPLKPDKTLDLELALSKSKQHKSIESLKKTMGLAEPTERITLKTESKTITIELGNKEPGKSGYYALVNGHLENQNLVYILPTHTVNRFRVKPNKIIRKKLSPTHADLVSKVVFTADIDAFNTKKWFTPPAKPPVPKNDKQKETYEKRLAGYKKKLDDYNKLLGKLPETVRLTFDKKEKVVTNSKGVERAKVEWSRADNIKGNISAGKSQNAVRNLIKIKAKSAVDFLKPQWQNLFKGTMKTDCAAKINFFAGNQRKTSTICLSAPVVIDGDSYYGAKLKLAGTEKAGRFLVPAERLKTFLTVQ